MATHGSGGKAQGPEADVLVIFGITGDLAKKMTYDALYDLEARDPDVPVIGVAIDDLTEEALRKRMREAVEAAEEDVDEKVFKRLATGSPTSTATTRTRRPSRRWRRS